MEDHKPVGEKRTSRADVNAASSFTFASASAFMLCAAATTVGSLSAFSMMIAALISGREMYVGSSRRTSV